MLYEQLDHAYLKVRKQILLGARVGYSVMHLAKILRLPPSSVQESCTRLCALGYAHEFFTHESGEKKTRYIRKIRKKEQTT